MSKTKDGFWGRNLRGSPPLQLLSDQRSPDPESMAMNLDVSTRSTRAIGGVSAEAEIVSTEARCGIRWWGLLIICLAVMAAQTVRGAVFTTNVVSFTNFTTIALTNAAGPVPANPYPSVIGISNLIGQVSNVTV